jgi:hypothetical protein
VLVVRAQPQGEGLDDLVAPYPAREAQEVAERVGRGAILARAADEAVDPEAAGQSASTATALKPASSMRRRLIRARST